MTFEEEAAPEKKETAEEPVEAPQKKQKNRVGAMFDLLTFSDI